MLLVQPDSGYDARSKSGRRDSYPDDEASLRCAARQGPRERMTTLRAVVADDERPARRFLTNLLTTCGHVEVVGEAASGEEAIEDLSPLSTGCWFRSPPSMVMR